MGRETFGDRERLEDMLASQKHISGLYNESAGECASPAVKSVLMNILNEEHQMQHEVFSQMQKRGWYNPVPAEQSSVDQAREKFSKMQQG